MCPQVGCRGDCARLQEAMPMSPVHDMEISAQGFHRETFEKVLREGSGAPGLATCYAPEHPEPDEGQKCVDPPGFARIFCTLGGRSRENARVPFRAGLVWKFSQGPTRGRRFENGTESLAHLSPPETPPGPAGRPAQQRPKEAEQGGPAAETSSTAAASEAPAGT